jgi:signal peptidase II
MTQPSPARGLVRWLLIALLVIVLDQVTKALVVEQFDLGDSRYVAPFFNLVRAHNPGAAFSFLAGADGWQRWFFIVLGFAASGFIVWMILRHPGQTLFCFAVSLILGGALGNVVDRLVHGHVIDFIQVHWAGWFFPSFNVADSAITAGAVLLIVDELLRVRHTRTA